MKNNKGKKGLIISIIIVLIILIGLGAVYVVLGTDLLKSNKDLFFKYASKVFDKENGIIDENIMNYYDKKLNMPYSNNGKFEVEISSSNNAVKSQMKNTNNMDITFDGQVDLKSSNFEENVNINYSNNVTFPITLKKVDDLVGFQTDYVGVKFITTELNKIGDTINNNQNNSLNDEVIPSVDMSILENGENIVNKKITEEEKNYFYVKYLSVIKDNIPDSCFSKVNENGKIGYKLSLNGENVKTVVIKLLETLKDDDLALEKINDFYGSDDSSSKLTKEDLSDLIEEINPEKIKVDNIIFTIYKDANKISNVQIEISNVKLNIENKKSNNDSSLSVAIEQDNNKLLLNMKYTGLQTDNPEVEHELQLSTQIKDIISNNTVINEDINKEKETIQKIINKVKTNKNTEEGVTETITIDDIKKVIDEEGYQDVNASEETGHIIKIEFKNTQDYFEIDSNGEIISSAEGQNNNLDNSDSGDSLTYTYKFSNNIKFQNSVNIENYTDDNSLNLDKLDKESRDSLVKRIMERIDLINKKQMEELGISNNQNPMGNMIPILFVYNIANGANNANLDYNNNSNSFSNVGEGLNNALITSFNNRFEKYEGNNLTGATVKGLLTEIGSNNGLTYDEDEEQDNNNDSFKIEEINFNGQEYKDITDQTIKGIKEEIAVEDGYRVSFERKEETGVIYRVVINKK